MQCTGNVHCFLQGKRAAILRLYPAGFFMRAAVSCLHTTGCEAYSFTTDGYGIFNVRTCIYYLGVCRVHTKEGQAYKQVCTRVDSEGQKN